MHGPRKYRRGAWGVGSRPIRHKFFQSSTLSTVLFKENYNFPSLQRGPTFSGGGSNFSRGVGGGGTSIRIQITCYFPGRGFGPPFPLWILTWKLTLQMFCSWSEDVHVMCFGHYRQIIFSVTFLWTCDRLNLHFRYDFDAPRIWARVWGVGNCWGVCPLCYNDVMSFTF